MKTSPKLFIFLILAAASVALHADTYNYVIIAGDSGSPAVFNASGTMTGTPDPYDGSALNLTGITGGAFEYTFSGVASAASPVDSMTPATDPATGITFNNVVYNAGTDSPSIDAYGVLLTMNSGMGASYAHVYNTDAGFVVDVLDPNEPGAQTPFEVAASLGVLRFSMRAVPESPVPEPATWMLLGTGAVAAGGMALRRRKLMHDAA